MFEIELTAALNLLIESVRKFVDEKQKSKIYKKIDSGHVQIHRFTSQSQWMVYKAHPKPKNA